MTILGLVFIVVALIVFMTGHLIESPILSITAFIMSCAAVVTGVVLIAADNNDYQKETIRMCNEKHGVVTLDYQCFVDGEPVQFSPGVWVRQP
jgi:hypothetical protein